MQLVCRVYHTGFRSIDGSLSDLGDIDFLESPDHVGPHDANGDVHVSIHGHALTRCYMCSERVAVSIDSSSIDTFDRSRWRA